MEGESVLYPFKTDKVRNCGNLYVPLSLCMCQLEHRNVSSDRAMAAAMAEYLIAKMNIDIEKNNHTTLCAKLVLNPIFPVEVMEIEPNKRFHAYKVTFKVRLS